MSIDRSITPWLVGGHWVAPNSADRLPVRDPATGKVIGEIAYGGAADAEDAANAATDAFKSWSDRPARERAEILRTTGHLLLERSQAIGQLLSAETGKKLDESIGETRYAAEYFRFYAEECRRPRGELLTSEDPARRQLTLTRPAGIAACLTPWNFPLSIQARKVAPALAAGCTLVARASEKAPLAVVELFRALVDAGLPPGVANLVQGPSASQSTALLDHPSVRVVSFTGSTPVGASIMTRAARRIVRCALELGGDAPFLVFSDADLDAAVQGLLLAKFRNNGQSCIAANRVFVEEPVLGEFCERLASAMEQIGPIGPLIDEERVAAVEELTEAAIRGGASFVAEAPRSNGPCWSRAGFMVGVPADSDLATSEVFGPVAGIFSFFDEEEAVERANATEMGLAGYAWTRDSARCWRLSERLEVGILGLNHALPSVTFAPMGGMKQSGLGREGAHQGLDEFLETRYVSIGV